MTQKPAQNLKEALARVLTEQTGLVVEPSEIRLPARGAAAGWRVLQGYGAEALAEKMSLPAGRFLGASLIGVLRAEKGYLLITLADECYSSLASAVAASRPLPGDDLGNRTLNRLLCLARKPGRGCPGDPGVQNALLHCLCLGAGIGLPQAERAVDGMFHSVQPKARQALTEAAGETAGACARLLYEAILTKGTQSI